MRRFIILLISFIMILPMMAGEFSHFFWKAGNNDVTVYLCGSVHLLKPEFYPLREEIENAFAGSDALVVEFDITKMDIGKIQQMIMTEGMYQDERTLETTMPAEYYQKLGKVISDCGYNLEQFKMQKPWYMTMTHSSLMVQSLGYRSEAGVDMYFLNKAGEDKEILQLETPESQFRLLSEMDEQLQMDYLLESLDEIDDFARNIEEWTQSWQQGDDDKMYELMCDKIKSVEKLEKFYDLLFTQRNLTMTDKIEGYLQGEGKKTYFVVAGSGHFLGKEGIVELLRDRGYNVERN
ncbi:MAG: TraB/GumN family protein [Candidatus Cloacimonetes bacterium]|nr:TraB/GumN family protein [Candidatus Cloacimonadota bacterium]